MRFEFSQAKNAENNEGSGKLKLESFDNKDKNYLSKILDQIKSPDVKELILDNSESGNIQAVIFGIKPSCLLNEKEASLIADNLPPESGLSAVSGVLFNKYLIEEVARNNPDYFNYSELKAEKIIEDIFVKGDGMKNAVQFGLLLGFPKQAAEDFQRMNGKAKSLFNLIKDKIIPPNSPDWNLLKGLEDEERKFINENYENIGECPMRPKHIFEDVKYLFYKYLPKDIADISWEFYQGKAVKIGGIYWMEWTQSMEGEKLKKKYKEVFENPIFKNNVEQEKDNLCIELVNEKVKGTLNKENVIEIKKLSKKLRSEYSRVYQLEIIQGTRDSLHLRECLGYSFNPINGKPINSAQDLIEYLKMQIEVYGKEV